MTFKLLQLVSLYFWMNQRQRLSAALNAAGQVRQKLSAVGEDRQWQWLNAALLDRRQWNAACSTQCCWARQAEAQHDH